MPEPYPIRSTACPAKARLVPAEKRLDDTGHYIDVFDGGRRDV